ncbi:MAG: hypothetical protein EA367_16080 [Leptolyngbya sp. DLM2.Bin15]|nr:MAG: hypothetical protein EA367_16080 [Leptolyngbya sp. DLM2.Bin15]
MGAVGNFNASLTGIAVNNNLDMRLIRDINSNGVVDSGDEVVRAAAGGNQNDSINVQSLVAGNYFLQTYLHSGTSSNYTLRMSNTGGSPSNLLGPEVNVGTLSTTPFSRFSTLSTNNASDTYSFTMGAVGNFNASLTGIAVNHNLDMRLIRDVNSNGVVDSGDEVIRAAAGGNQNDSINIRSLAAGNYVLQTYLHSGTSSNYTLRMSNTGGSPSNLVGPEVNVGTLSTTPFSRFSTLSNNNASDTYSFTMGSVGNFNASLTGIAASHDLDMRLIRDVNNNNIVDSGDVLVTSTAGGNRDEAINVRSLAAGNYLLQTYLYSGTSSSYTLRMSNTGNSGGSPSNLLPIETSIGTIGSPITRSGSVGVNNASDTFRFSMASSRRVTLNLIGLSADADLRLIRDANNNGIVDAGEVIGRSSASGTSNERLSMSLTGGVSYIAQVYFYSSTGSTSYNLGIAPSIIPFPF